MNKYSKYFAIAASVALVGCSNEGANDAPVNPAEGETAYMKVALRDANGGRAEEGEFLYGEGMEGHAANAQFFFFNADGVYMAQANYNPIGGTSNTENPDGNIEFTGDAVVVLENIKSKDAPTYPNYMITLVNCNGEFPEDMLKGKTMQWFSEQISNWGEGDAARGRFRMSSTSYFNGDVAYTDHNDAYYYATALSSDNFARTPELAIAQEKPVKVFVERLAARVSLTCKDIFEVKATVAGMENGVVGVPEAATKLFVRIDGWGLNGTCPESHISKQLTGWKANTKFGGTDWEFNAPGNRRSYWGQSTLYGTTYDEATFATNLNFFPAKDLKNSVETVLYCNENTNTKAALRLDNGLPNQRLLTSATITATVGTKDAEGNFVPTDLVEHNGVYFEKDAFVAYVLGILDNNKKLKYYTRTQKGTATEEGVLTDGEYAYKQVEASMFDIDGDNKAVYVVKGKSFPTEQLYTYTLDENNERVWATTDAATLAQDLKDATKDLKTIGFKGGQMTYNIPIAHENTKMYDENNDLTNWFEASFGVVRNHAYQIKVNSIKRLGNGVFNPDDATDPVIPDKDPKDPNWYMGAEINILSWKIVNNSVDL